MRRVLRILAALSFVAFSGVLCAEAENAEAFSGNAVFYSFPLKKQIEETPENERFALLIGRKVDVDEFVDFCEKYPDIAKREQLSSAEAEAKNRLVRKLATQMPEATILERAKQATQLLADLNNSETLNEQELRWAEWICAVAREKCDCSLKTPEANLATDRKRIASLEFLIAKTKHGVVYRTAVRDYVAMLLFQAFPDNRNAALDLYEASGCPQRMSDVLKKELDELLKEATIYSKPSLIKDIASIRRERKMKAEREKIQFRRIREKQHLYEEILALEEARKSLSHGRQRSESPGKDNPGILIFPNAAAYSALSLDEKFKILCGRKISFLELQKRFSAKTSESEKMEAIGTELQAKSELLQELTDPTTFSQLSSPELKKRAQMAKALFADIFSEPEQRERELSSISEFAAIADSQEPQEFSNFCRWRDLGIRYLFPKKIYSNFSRLLLAAYPGDVGKALAMYDESLIGERLRRYNSPAFVVTLPMSEFYREAFFKYPQSLVRTDPRDVENYAKLLVAEIAREQQFLEARLKNENTDSEP